MGSGLISEMSFDGEWPYKRGGYCMFNVSFFQAPKSMKSFIQAAFLLNTAFGNLIVAIISEIRLFSNEVSVE